MTPDPALHIKIRLHSFRKPVTCLPALRKGDGWKLLFTSHRTNTPHSGYSGERFLRRCRERVKCGTQTKKRSSAIENDLSASRDRFRDEAVLKSLPKAGANS